MLLFFIIKQTILLIIVCLYMFLFISIILKRKIKNYLYIRWQIFTKEKLSCDYFEFMGNKTVRSRKENL